MEKAACYVIDLDVTRPELSYLDEDGLNEDFTYFQTNSLDDLSDNDRKYFKTESEASTFLKTYLKTMDGLKNEIICKDKNLPNLLYKRRYIVLSLLGLKNQTYRHYLKPWKKGQLINLYDQTFFLTVEIVSITEIEDGNYEYKFKLPKT